jgi:hypothetical protein
MKTNRLLCTMIAAAALVCRASAGASSNRPSRDEESKTRQSRFHAEPKGDIRHRDEKELEKEKGEADNVAALHSPGLKKWAEDVIDALKDAKANIIRAMSVRPPTPVPFPEISARNVRNRDSGHPAMIGGPANAKLNTAAINGTEMKHKR